MTHHLLSLLSMLFVLYVVSLFVIFPMRPVLPMYVMSKVFSICCTIEVQVGPRLSFTWVWGRNGLIKSLMSLIVIGSLIARDMVALTQHVKRLMFILKSSVNAHFLPYMFCFLYLQTLQVTKSLVYCTILTRYNRATQMYYFMCICSLCFFKLPLTKWIILK